MKLGSPSTRSYPDAYHAPSVAVEERVLGRVLEVVGVAQLVGVRDDLASMDLPTLWPVGLAVPARAEHRRAHEYRGDHHVILPVFITGTGAAVQQDRLAAIGILQPQWRSG